MNTMNFITMKDGTIINLNAVAWIDANTGPRLGLGAIRIVFPAMKSSNGDLYNSLDLTLSGEEAEEFLSALDKLGINTKALRKSRQPPTRGAFGALRSASKIRPSDAGKPPGLPDPKK
jgi:hypothetical protein